MTARDDFPGEMHEFPFDNSDADAVFGATSGADSVPEELRDVAELVYVARREGSIDELAGADVIVAQIAAAIREHAAPPRGDAHERISVFNKIRSAKLAAAATVVVVLGGTAAAATTGSLPSPVHRSAESKQSAPAIKVSARAKVALANKRDAQKAQAKRAQANAAKAKAKAELRRSLAKKHAARVAAARHAHQQHKAVGGTVAAVNGVTDAGTCGTAGAAGTFTLNGWKGATLTVNVDGATKYHAKDVDDASFANVCVGMLALAKGTIADSTVAATKVLVAPAHEDNDDHERRGAFGKVAAVNGATAEGSCGAAGAAGSFTLTEKHGATFTVNVDASAKFRAKGSDDSFASVCVGEKVAVFGEVTDTTIAATKVFVFGDRWGHGNRWGNGDHKWNHDGDHKRHDGDHDGDRKRHDGDHKWNHDGDGDDERRGDSGRRSKHDR